MRGEHALPECLSTRFPGSSPHARGALISVYKLCRDVGIIPACAGSTRRRRAFGHVHGDHPRMRGEHSPVTSPSSRHGGSSPHARGALVHDEGVDSDGGIIPACAGSTEEVQNVLVAPGDHPRMRGEHFDPMNRSYMNQGSSPHARGAQVLVRREKVAGGIIPACAGSTQRNRLFCIQHKGSSPHARGARRRAGEDRVHGGIIPACAGSTRSGHWNI